MKNGINLTLETDEKDPIIGMAVQVISCPLAGLFVPPRALV
jgi:hypothetical protein